MLRAAVTEALEAVVAVLLVLQHRVARVTRHLQVHHKVTMAGLVAHQDKVEVGALPPLVVMGQHLLREALVETELPLQFLAHQ